MINGTYIVEMKYILPSYFQMIHNIYLFHFRWEKSLNIFGSSVLINYYMTWWLWFLILRPTFRTAETLILFSYNSRQSESNWRHIEDSLNRTMRLNANDSDGKVDKIRCHSYWRQNCKYGLEFKGFCILVIYHTINTRRVWR